MLCAMFLSGVIEGFYGPPWTMAERLEAFASEFHQPRTSRGGTAARRQRLLVQDADRTFTAQATRAER